VCDVIYKVDGHMYLVSCSFLYLVTWEPFLYIAHVQCMHTSCFLIAFVRSLASYIRTRVVALFQIYL